MTDDCRLSYFMRTCIFKMYILLCTFLQYHLHKNISILNTGYDVALHDEHDIICQHL